jgi:hypothetical protein
MWTGGITMAVASMWEVLMPAGMSRRVDREIVSRAVLGDRRGDGDLATGTTYALEADKQ